jgi:hypothetical protein
VTSKHDPRQHRFPPVLIVALVAVVALMLFLAFFGPAGVRIL